jgi:Fe-S cluster assembly ATP-binding protein
MLRIANLTVECAGVRILNNLCMYVREGEKVALLGPNGSGKTTLFLTIMGNKCYRVRSGRIFFKGEDITELETHERVRRGIGIVHQAVPRIRFLRLKDILKKYDYSSVSRLAKLLSVEHLLEREFNCRFSGGEVKRVELLQVMLQNPELVLLDEIDSGVDRDSMEIVGRALKEFLKEKACIVTTHTGKILEYVDVSYCAVMYKGRIACIGEKEEILALIERYGYKRCIERCLKER